MPKPQAKSDGTDGSNYKREMYYGVFDSRKLPPLGELNPNNVVNIDSSQFYNAIKNIDEYDEYSKLRSEFKF